MLVDARLRLLVKEEDPSLSAGTYSIIIILYGLYSYSTVSSMSYSLALMIGSLKFFCLNSSPTKVLLDFMVDIINNIFFKSSFCVTCKGDI